MEEFWVERKSVIEKESDLGTRVRAPQNAPPECFTIAETPMTF